MIYAFWHESILYFAWSHRRRGVSVMISRHGDGELIARTVELLGFSTARGSSSKGGPAALRTLARQVQSETRPITDMAMTPDGPRGPRRVVQGGILELAARTGLPIVPAAVSYARSWRAGSWDRMRIPKPFTRAVVLFGEPLWVPGADGWGDDAREVQRTALERRLIGIAERVESEFELLHRSGHRKLSSFDPWPSRSTPEAAVG